MSLAKPRIEIYAHRGGAGLYPENTLPAYEAALRGGADVLDIDVGVTRDEVVVAYHDSSLNPAYTRYLSGKNLKKPYPLICDLSFEALQNFDVGCLNKDTAYGKSFPNQRAIPNTRIASLQAIVQYAKRINPHIRFQIEIKTNPYYPEKSILPDRFSALVAEVIDKEKIYKQTEVHSFDWKNMLTLQKIDPQIMTSYITSRHEQRRWFFYRKKWFAGYELRKYDYSFPKLISALGGKGWSPDYRDLKFESVEEAHRYGLKVVVWTVDKIEDMQRFIAMQVDGIVTNRPDILKKCL